ncbi:MAG: transposase, partial [Thermoanaerobaculia bacterium]|nr:transposase [Thermoanaerobaculia bacterium]
MRKRRFSEEQIIGVLKAAEAGMAVKEVCRQHGVTEATYYRWKKKFGGMEVSEVKRLRQLEEENRRLKTLVADLTLDKQALQWALEKSGDLAGPARGLHRDPGAVQAERAASDGSEPRASIDCPIRAAAAGGPAPAAAPAGARGPAAAPRVRSALAAAAPRGLPRES